MNIELDKIFNEIGRLHMQVSALQEALSKAQADLAVAQAAPAPPKE